MTNTTTAATDGLPALKRYAESEMWGVCPAVCGEYVRYDDVAAMLATARVADGRENKRDSKDIVRNWMGENDVVLSTQAYRTLCKIIATERAATQPAGEVECRATCNICADENGNAWPCAKGKAFAAPISEASAAAAVDVVALLDEQKAEVKQRNGDWWRGYEAALHWIGKAIEEKQSEVQNEN